MIVKELRAVLDELVAQDYANNDLPIFSECGHGSGVSDSVDAYAVVRTFDPDEIEGGEITDEKAGFKYFPVFVG